MNQKKYKRRQWIIDPEFQFGFIRRVAGLVVLIIALALVLLAVVYQRYNEVEVFISQPLPFEIAGLSNASQGIDPGSTAFSLLWPVLLVSIAGTTLIMGFFGVVTSHRLAGPVYHIRRILGLMLKGDFNARVHLRKKDAFHSLADDINSLGLKLKDSITAMQELVQEMENNSVEESDEHIDRLRKIIAGLTTDSEAS